MAYDRATTAEHFIIWMWRQYQYLFSRNFGYSLIWDEQVFQKNLVKKLKKSSN
jgi:hypothetical protein